MRGYLDRDANGFWVARLIIEEARRPGVSGAGDVRTRHRLPVPPSARERSQKWRSGAL